MSSENYYKRMYEELKNEGKICYNTFEEFNKFLKTPRSGPLYDLVFRDIIDTIQTYSLTHDINGKKNKPIEFFKVTYNRSKN